MDCGDVPDSTSVICNEGIEEFQTWFVSRKLTPEQTNSILYHCREMITGVKPISQSIWEKIKQENKLKLNWKDHVNETVKSMKRKYNKEKDKKSFTDALEIARKKTCYHVNNISN